jgi:hypothetical protein
MGKADILVGTMKLTALLLLFSLPALAQSLDQAKFKEAESHAPKGYPTLFVVTSSSITPASLGDTQGCVMNIETLGRSYFVVGQAGWFAPCKAIQPGSPVWGHVHQMVDQVVDIIDPADPKPKSHRYFVRDITLLDPASQR